MSSVAANSGHGPRDEERVGVAARSEELGERLVPEQPEQGAGDRQGGGDESGPGEEAAGAPWEGRRSSGASSAGDLRDGPGRPGA